MKRALPLILTAAALAACGPAPVVLVDVEVPADVSPKTWQVYGTTGAQRDYGLLRGAPSLSVESSMRRMTLELPKDTRGALRVSVYGLMDDACVGAEGTGEVTLGDSAGPYSVKVALKRRDFRLCDGKGAQLRALTVLPGPVLFAAGDGGVVLRWDAQRGWSQPDTGTTKNLLGIWGKSEVALWAVGEGGTLLRWNGSAFSAEKIDFMGTLNGVGGDSTEEAWAVGEGATVLRYQNQKWTPVKVNLGEGAPMVTLSAVAVGRSGVLVVGDAGTLLRWEPEKAELQRIPTGKTEWLKAIATQQMGARSVMVGTGGRVLALTNKTVSVLKSNSSEVLTGVSLSEEGEILAVGERGTLLNCSAATDLMPCAAMPVLGPLTDLRSIAASPRADAKLELWVAGGYNGNGAGRDLLLHYRE